MKKGDRVLIKGSAFSFDGEMGVVMSVFGSDAINVMVPGYAINPDCCGLGWTISKSHYRLLVFWTDRLEAEKELDLILAKYAA